MIEDCSDLLQCEARLAPEAARTSLLGQIALTREDVDHLARLIREKLAPHVSGGTCFLERQAPTCLACFLVWMGITGYREGDYWSAVQEALGLELDANCQGRLGQSFLVFLRERGLPHPAIEGSYPYVTPILLHGGIPNSCLGEFFERVVLPMLRRDLMDPTDPKEIVQELAFCREDDEGRSEMERRCAVLRREARTLNRQIKLLGQAVAAHDQVLHLWQLEEEAARLDLSGLPEDPAAFWEGRVEELDRLDHEIQALQQRQAQCQQVLVALTWRDRRVLAQAKEIERCVSEYPRLKEQLEQADLLEIHERESALRIDEQSKGILNQPWQDEYGQRLLQLPLDELGEEIARLEAIASQQVAVQQTLDRHAVQQTTPSRGRRLLLYALAALALVLILPGIVVAPAWPLAVAGLGLIIVAVLVGWSWQRRRAKIRQEREALESSLCDLGEQQRTVQESIAGLLSDLPVSRRLVHSPAMELRQALASLADMYADLQEVRRRREELLEQTRPRVQFIQRLRAALEIQSALSLDDAVAEMERQLLGARQRHQAAVQAEDGLENVIGPRLADLNAQRQALVKRLEAVGRRLAVLGEGDIQAGIERIQTQRRLIGAARDLRAALDGEYPNLEVIEGTIRAARSKAALAHRIKQLEAERKGVLAQARALKTELSHCPSVFPGVDEPIRRYLLYGGPSAENLLVGSVSLLHRTLSDGEVPEPREVDLPDRVVAAFEEWWNEYRQREPQTTGALSEAIAPRGQRFRAPIILLDPVAAEVMVSLPVQRYPASLGGSRASIEVLGSVSGMRQTWDLRLYASAPGLVETQDRDLRLLFPDERYEFNLTGNGQPIRRWAIAGMGGQEPYMAFEWRSGRLIREPRLPQARVWLLVRRDSMLEPEQVVLAEQVPLLDYWQEYGFFELDLSGVDELRVTDGQGRCLSLPVSSEVPPDLGLEGGRHLEGAASEGAAVYLGSPPCIRVPIQDEAELPGWRLSVVSDMDDDLREGKNFRLCDLGTALEIAPGGRWVDVLLADERLLGRRPLGRFMLRLRKRPYTDWRLTVCVVPDLQIEFDQGLYVPGETGKPDWIQASVTVAEDMEFVARPPAEILAKDDNSYTIGIDRGEDALRGLLYRRGAQETRVPLTFAIPKVRWRLQGLEEGQQDVWHDTVEEVWLGDWETAAALFLVVALPRFVEGSLRLSLGDHPRREARKSLRDGKARFDLLGFGEVFRAGPALQTFSLTLPDSRFGVDNTPLLSVRTRWEAEELECVQEQGHGVNLLTVTWVERGKTGGRDRIVRLWRLEAAATEPLLQEKVPEGEQRVAFEARVTEVPPGEYLFQIALEDPWSPPSPSRPSPGEPNTVVIEIVPSGDIRKDELLCLCSIDDLGRRYELERGVYQIRIIGKIINRQLPTRFSAGVLVTRTNEGWYVGNLEAPPGSEVETEIADSNPVKLEYDASRNRITGIEDRYGDGAMYCLDCCRLYWRQETIIEEQRKKHRIIGPIEVFGVRWE